MPYYEFHLLGPFKPYVRMTQRGKWVRPEAQKYLASKENLQWQFRTQMQGEMIPRGTPLAVEIYIHPANHRRDIDNELKALLDAAQGIVFEDDRWVDEVTIQRISYNFPVHGQPQITMWVQPSMQGGDDAE